MTDDGLGSKDSVYMRRALEVAERGWGRVAPNPLVGAVLVQDDRVVGEGWHREYGQAHAEVEALSAAGEAARGATMYVTLEPCNHRGKTGPCTEALLAAGVRRVVYACADPDPVARGGGEVLAQAGVDVQAGVEEEAARALNAPFLHAANPAAPRRPWLELKLAVSLDGRTADIEGKSSWITGEEARAEVHRLRAGRDAIAVGIGTVLADDPLLTARAEIVPRRAPVRVILDRNLRLPLSSRLLQTVEEAPVWVIGATGASPSQRKALEERGARVFFADDLSSGMAMLFREGIHSVFCEGGATVAGSLLREDLVNRLTLFQAPLLLGAQATNPFAGIDGQPLDQAHRWRPVRRATFGPDTMISLDR